MLLRLSRLSFWLAAAAAALGLLAPRGHETLLTVIAGIGSALAFGLWRSALRSKGPGGLLVSLPSTSAERLGAPALGDATALLSQAIREAASFEAALHAVGKVLRGELGARELTVHEVHGVDHTHARISALIEEQPGFKTVKRRIRLDAMPLGVAIHRQQVAGDTPGHLAVPVAAQGRVVAALELGGVELAFEPEALRKLLDLARTSLSEFAAGASRKTQFGQTPEQPRPALARNGERIRDPRSDDDAPRFIDPTARMPAMLSSPPNPRSPAGSSESGAPGVAESVLDAAALKRLTDLDPTGANHLLERVLQAFQTSVARLRPQAEAARESGDRSALRLVAHTLKSSSASIGAMRLSQLCGQIESVIRQNTGEDLAPYHEALGRALDEALAAIASLLKEQT